MNDQLSIRLNMVYSAIDPDKAQKGRVIDVGSDHGLLALRCLKEDLTPFCICTDIHKLPAKRTEDCLKDHNMSSRSEVFCTDGLVGVELKAFDTVVMAGLGGNTIMNVIKEVMTRTSEEILRNVDFVLQPQKTSDELRVFLCENGFDIVFEDVSIDRDLFYHMMRAVYTGQKHGLTSLQKFYGPVLITREDDTAVKFREHLDEIYKVRSRGNAELKALMEERHVL